MKKLLAPAALLVSLLAAFLLYSPPTSAATATANLNVSVVVDSACLISTSAVGFPVYMPIGVHASSADNSTSGSVTVTCTVGTSATIAMSYGANAVGSQARMTNGVSSFINYSLFQDASHLTAWGPSAPNLYTLSPAPDTSPRVVPVYASIPAGQSPADGNHSDTVLATVNF